MSNAPIAENEADPEEARPADEEVSWFERLLATFGLGEEPDLRVLIEDALARSKSDALSGQERTMLRRILRFGTLTVEDVMVPRADIIAVDDTVTVDELMRVFRQAEHSRVPVYRQTLDDPRGMVHIRDLLAFMTARARVIDTGKIKRKKPFPAGLDQGRGGRVIQGEVGHRIRLVVVGPALLPRAPPSGAVARSSRRGRRR